MERIRVQNPGLEKFLQAEEGNTLCADCNAKKPRWASVSLGIFICTNCAGIHRKLGVHISFVQSCTIDKWKPEWITKFSKMGNSVAKMYYEHGITEEVIASLPVELQQVLLHGEDLKLTSGDSMSVEDAAKLEDWIRRKYERKEFCLHAYPDFANPDPSSIIVPPEPKVLVQQGKDPRSEYDSFLELYYGVPPPAAAGGTASGTQGTGRSGAASSSSTGLNNGGNNAGGATAAQMNFQRSTSRETRGGEEPASSSTSRRQRERGTTGAGAAAGSGRNQEDAGSFWNNAAGFSDHFEHAGVGEQVPAAPSREQGTRRRKKKSSAYNSANEESNGEHNFMPPSAGSFFGNTFPGGGTRTATTAAPAPAPASFAEPAGAFPAPPQTGNEPGGRPAEMYNWQRDPTATYNSYSTSRNPPVDHLPGRARMGSGGPGPAATGSFSPQEVGGPAPLSPQWHDWQQQQAVAAHRNMMMTQQHRVQAGGMTNPAGVWSSATVQQIQQNQSVAPLPNVDLAQLAAIFGLSGCEPGEEVAGNGGKQARKKSSRPHEQLTVLQAEEHQTAGLRKQHEWQLMIDEHYPEHARRQAERGARKRHALAAVTRLFSEKTAVAELFDPANLILPFGLNIHAKRFEFDSGMRMSTDYDRSKGSGCKMNGGKRMPVSTASVGVQTGEDLLLHYIQQKLLRESQRLLEAKMKAIGGGGGMGSGFGFSAAEGNRNVGPLHMGAGTGMAPGGGPATYIAPP